MIYTLFSIIEEKTNLKNKLSTRTAKVFSTHILFYLIEKTHRKNKVPLELSIQHSHFILLFIYPSRKLTFRNDRHLK